MFDNTDQDAMNQQHLIAPLVGDYWHEIFMPVLCVVRVDDKYVMCLTKTDQLPNDRWTWDLNHLETFTRGEFKQKLSCVSIPCTWADVLPEGQKWAADAVRDAFCKHTDNEPQMGYSPLAVD